MRPGESRTTIGARDPGEPFRYPLAQMIAAEPKPPRALWSRGYRPFFLLAGFSGFTLLPAWLAIRAGLALAPEWLAPFEWHAHEMEFGLVSAAVAGFLLTSVPVWTGQPPVVGARLVALVALWIAGRLAMIAPGVLAPGVIAAVDLAFLSVLAISVARPIWRARSRRNYGVPLLIVALALANGMTHLEALGGAAVGRLGLRMGAYLLTTLLVVIGGRITPAFTRNYLVRQGVSAPVRTRRWLERLLFGALVSLLGVELVAGGTLLAGSLELSAAALMILRLAGWQSLRVLREPLLWSLHLGQTWIAVGLACTGIADSTHLLLWSTGLHALTVGGFGTMLLAVMTRVGLAHTGRSLEVPRGIPLAYSGLSVAALTRVCVPIFWPEWTLEGIVFSGVLFAAAFAGFSWIYAPWLVAPRIDGGEG